MQDIEKEQDMSRYIKDKDGDHIEVGAEDDGVTEGVTLTVTQQDRFDGETTTHHATVGPIDPHELIAAIHGEMGWDRPSPIIESVAEQINSGELKVDGPADAAIENTVSFEEALGRRSNLRTLDEEIDARAAAEEEDAPLPPETFPRSYVHTTAATAEQPRVWAGADEPIIDQLIGRVADLEEEKERTEAHQHLADHWERRMDVVQRALTMIPTQGKRGGILAAFAGEDVPQSDRVEKALKIARFAADEEREIPGVDR